MIRWRFYHQQFDIEKKLKHGYIRKKLKYIFGMIPLIFLLLLFKKKKKGLLILFLKWQSFDVFYLISQYKTEFLLGLINLEH